MIEGSNPTRSEKFSFHLLSDGREFSLALGQGEVPWLTMKAVVEEGQSTERKCKKWVIGEWSQLTTIP